VIADVSTAEGQEALLAACRAPDILINNNAVRPFRDFHELDRSALLTGVTMNMVTPIELHSKGHRPHGRAASAAFVNITSISVKMPVPGLDLSSASRAGLTAFVAGVARKGRRQNVTINNLLPGNFNTSACATASPPPPNSRANPNRSWPPKPWPRFPPSASAL